MKKMRKRTTLIMKCNDCHHTQTGSGRGNGVSRCRRCRSTNLWGIPLGKEQKISIDRVYEADVIEEEKARLKQRQKQMLEEIRIKRGKI